METSTPEPAHLTPKQPKVSKPNILTTLWDMLHHKRAALMIGGSLALIVILVIGLLVWRGGTSNRTVASTDSAESTSETGALDASTGYTGIKADVLTNQTFDCVPRSDHEWYRSDRTFTIDPANPDTMYLNVEYKGFYKTTDGGKTWTQKTKGLKVYARSDDKTKGCYSEYPVVRIDPRDHKHLILAMSGGGGGFLDATTPNSQTGGAYQSFDGGDSWKLMINNKMNIYVTDLAFDPSNTKTIYYGTSSNPASWQEADQTKLYVTKGLIYKTTDTAKTWTELSTGIGERSGPTAIMVSTDGKQITAPTYSAVRESADGTGTGLSSGKDTSAVSQMGILKSSDSGKTWSSIQLPGSPAISYGIGSNTAYNHMFFRPEGTNGAISYVSLDGAQTFKKTSQALDIVAYDPFDPTGNHMLGYSTTAGTPPIPSLNLFESSDGGLTWKAWGSLPAEITDLNDTKIRPSVIVWHPTDKNTIYMAGGGGHVWKSTDLGSTWTTLLDYTQLK